MCPPYPFLCLAVPLPLSRSVMPSSFSLLRRIRRRQNVQTATLLARVHSRYRRVLRDLPILDCAVLLHITVRRFFCDQSTCSRTTFTEELSSLAVRRAQRTMRRTQTLLTLGQALGGEAGARRAHRLRLAASPATVLRVIRAQSHPSAPSPRVLGVDDFAFRTGRVYGTLLVDLERSRPIDILGDRSAETLASWLEKHPGVEIITRDRASDYARGVTTGAPDAVQVADRFHLLCNLRELAERYAQRVGKRLRERVSATSTDEAVPDRTPTDEVPVPHEYRRTPRFQPPPGLRQTQAERKRRRAEQYATVNAYAAKGWSAQQIARAVGLSRHMVHVWLRADELPPDQRGYRGASKIDAFAPYLRQRLAEGCAHQSQLWREIHDQGFTGTRLLVAKWIQAHPDSEVKTTRSASNVFPTPKALAWLLVRPSEQLDDGEQ